MGKSAKVHKRIQKKLKSSTSALTSASASSSSSAQIQQVQVAKKHSKLKEKASKIKSHSTGLGSSQLRPGNVLGDADYVSLLLGGRRKATEEALKLPQNSESSNS